MDCKCWCGHLQKFHKDGFCTWCETRKRKYPMFNWLPEHELETTAPQNVIDNFEATFADMTRRLNGSFT